MASTFACWNSFTSVLDGSFVADAGCVVDVEAEAAVGDAGAAEDDPTPEEADAGAGEGDARDSEREDRARVVAALDEEASDVDLFARTSRAISKHVRSSVKLDSPPYLGQSNAVLLIRCRKSRPCLL
jgi:hypothetical protein